MYKHCDNSDEYISLHDCCATRISYANGIVTFTFFDGIWVTASHPDNKTGKTVRTDEAEVKFSLTTDEETTVYVFKEKFKKIFREEWQLHELMECINLKNCKLEFLYQYKGFNSIIIECCLWSDKKPYYHECELKIYLDDIKYCWNELREDREW